MSKMTRTVLVLVVILGTTIAGFLIYFSVSLRHIRLGLFTPADVQMLLSAANEARDAVEQHKACVLPIDESSLGNRTQEAEMLYLAAMLDLYRAKFGMAPRTLADLDRLRDFGKANRLDGLRLEKDCSVYLDPSGATAVSCGGTRPSNTDLAKLISSAEYVQKFYRLGNSEVLYVPVPKC